MCAWRPGAFTGRLHHHRGQYQQLLEAGAASELQALVAQEKVDSLRSERDAERQENQRLKALQTSGRSGRQVRLRQAIESKAQRIATLNREIREAELLLANNVITAPIEGRVFDLSVRPSDVIQRGNSTQPLMRIVPEGGLQAKIFIPNNAIGFIHTGQRADIALTSFNASEYGYLRSRCFKWAPMHSPRRNNRTCWGSMHRACISPRSCPSPIKPWMWASDRLPCKPA